MASPAAATRIRASRAHKPAFPPVVLATGLFVHMFLVGVPIALFVRAASTRVTA